MRQSLPNFNALKSCLFVLFATIGIAVHAQTPPPVPTGDSIQKFCSQATWQNAGFTFPGDNLGDLQVHGESLQWYSVDPATNPGATPIANPDSIILVDGDTYWVTQTVSSVESAALAVNVMEQGCACIKEPDFESQNLATTGKVGETDGYLIYRQDLSLHKTCGMQLGSTPSIPFGPINGYDTPADDAQLVYPKANLSLYQYDPQIEGYGINLPVTNPNNPNSDYAVRINGDGYSGSGQGPSDNSNEITMTKEFVAGEVLVFYYSMMLQNPSGHDYDAQPFFQVRLYDQNDNLIQSRCVVSTDSDCVFLRVIDVNPPGSPDPSTGNNPLYTEWSCFKLNTMDIQGEAARVEFTVGDCTAGGHLGHVYIDDFYVGSDAESPCNSFNFGYLAINEINPSTTTGNTCYVVQPPATPGACSIQATASLPFPMQVCGTYEAPISSGQAPNLDDLTINITQNGNVVGTVSNPTFTGNNFCFTIDETDINVPPYGDFEFSSSVTFGLDCGAAYDITIDDQADFEACPPAGCPLPLVLCDTSGNGTGIFDLTQRENVITNGWTEGVTYTYYEDPNDAYDQLNTITTPAAYTNTISGGQTIYVRADWDLPGTGNDNCFYLVEMDIEVLAVPVLDPIDDMILCGGANVNIPLSATPTNLADLQTITYEWFMDGVRLPVLGSTYTITAPGTYEVIVSNDLACSVTETFVVERVDYGVDLGDDLDLCGNEAETTLTANITDNGSTNPIDMSQVTYSWSTGETTPSITINSSGTYTVETTYKGCVQTDQINVVLAVKPEISLGSDFSMCVDDEVTLTASVANAGGNTFEYIWYRDGGVISGETGSSISITETGTYRVEAAESSAASCFGEDIIEVTLYANENCVITQGISPNGDQYNQNLDLTFLNDRTGIASVEIFNRHGRLVFEKTDGYTNEWFGQTSDGDELGTGTYFYVIKLDAVDKALAKQVLTGWIYVNRQVN